MNKLEAKKATDEFSGTIGDLHALIETRRNEAVGMSAVNPSIPLARALDMYTNALGLRPDHEKPTIWKSDPYSRSGRMKWAKDALIVQNILRDCA